VIVSNLRSALKCVHDTGCSRSACGHGQHAHGLCRRARACLAHVPRAALAGCAASRSGRPWPTVAWLRCRKRTTLGWPAVVPRVEPSHGCQGSVNMAPPVLPFHQPHRAPRHAPLSLRDGRLAPNPVLKSAPLRCCPASQSQRDCSGLTAPIHARHARSPNLNVCT
jgi:hypothetical protein